MPMKIAAVLELLAQDGWYLARTRGSHRQYRHPSKPGTVTVAGRPSDTLHPKTLASILRQAGLRDSTLNARYLIVVEGDEFDQLLRLLAGPPGRGGHGRHAQGVRPRDGGRGRLPPGGAP